MRSKAGSKRANVPFMRTGCRHILPATSPPPSLRKPPVVFRFAWRGPAQKEVDKGLWGLNAQKKRKAAMNKRRNAPYTERDEGEPWDWVRFLILELRLSGGRYWKGGRAGGGGRMGERREGDGRRATSLSFHALYSFLGKWVKADCSQHDAKVKLHLIDL